MAAQLAQPLSAIEQDAALNMLMVESTIVSWKDIVYLNNAAVGMLRQGQLEASIANLRHALERFQMELGQVHLLAVAPPHGDHHLHQENDKSSGKKKNISVLSIELGEKLSRRDLNSSPGNAFSIYNCAFCYRDEGDADPTQAATLLVVMLYNFALALHRQGLLLGQGLGQDNEYLHQALNLYQTAVSLIQRGGGAGAIANMDYDDSLRHLMLALWTNQGHIYSHFQQCDFVRICHNNLRLVFTNPPERPMVEQDHLFFLSTLISIPNSNVAPAA